jgi:membrane protease YdiL (CAAX protease family)
VHPGTLAIGLVRGLLAIVLLGILWAALHDISSGEADTRLEVVATAISLLALALLAYGWIRSRRRGSSDGPGAR